MNLLKFCSIKITLYSVWCIAFITVLFNCIMLCFRLFSQLPSMFASSKESKVILGPVVKAGLEALKVYCDTWMDT